VREDQQGKLTLIYRGYKLRYAEIAQRPMRDLPTCVVETSPPRETLHKFCDLGLIV
jgi:hypothetical protein